MTRFGLVGPSYASQSVNLDAQLTMNWYPEVDESGAGNAPIAMYPVAGTKTFVNLARTITPQVDGIGAFDQFTHGNGTGTAVTTPSAIPSSSPELAILLPAFPSSGGTFTPGAGWNLFASIAYDQAVTGSISGSGTLTSSAGWTAILALFKQVGASAPAAIQTQGFGGAWAIAQTLTFTNPVVTGDTVLAMFTIGNNLGFASGITVSDPDNGSNIFTQVASAVDTGTATEAQIWQCTNVIGRSGFRVQFSAPAHLVSSANLEIVEMPTGVVAVTQNGPVRGEFTITGRTFAVSGSDFDEILANGTFTNWGTVENDSLPVTMAASPQQLLLASAGTAYIFDLVANTLTPIAGATFDGPVSQAAICDDFFLLTIQDSKEFYVSAPLDATDWVTNGSAIVSVFPDNIVSMLVFQRQPWFFSDTQSVVYYDSGNIFPFDVNPNAFIEAGSAAENTPAIFNNSIAWLGADARGHGKVWLASGYTPTRISNHAIEFAIQGYSRIDDAVGWSWQDQGHEFYALYFPTPSVTWVYDANTGMWHQEGFWLQSVGQFRAAHRWNHTFNFGMHLVGDWQSARVYQMQIPTLSGAAWTFADDDGNPLRRVRRAPHISKEQKRQFFSELQVYVETGLGPIPPLVSTATGPSTVILHDENGDLWMVTIADNGTISLTSVPTGIPQTIILNDAQFPGQSFQLVVNADFNEVQGTEVPYSASYPLTYPMTTIPSLLQSALTAAEAF